MRHHADRAAHAELCAEARAQERVRQAATSRNERRRVAYAPPRWMVATYYVTASACWTLFGLAALEWLTN